MAERLQLRQDGRDGPAATGCGASANQTMPPEHALETLGHRRARNGRRRPASDAAPAVWPPCSRFHRGTARCLSASYGGDDALVVRGDDMLAGLHDEEVVVPICREQLSDQRGIAVKLFE